LKKDRKITVKLYSIFREMSKTNELVLNINKKVKIRDLIKDLVKLNPGFSKALSIINENNIIFLDDNGRRLKLDDEIDSRVEVLHIMPPPEGGETLVLTGIVNVNSKIDVNELIRKAAESTGGTGGIAIFIGVVRKLNPDTKPVKALYYESAEKFAGKKLREIAIQVAEQYRLSLVAAYHYVGMLKPGDITLVVVTAGISRKQVFPALERLVERIKREVPIWKKEIYIDGSFSYIVGGRRITPTFQ